MKYFSLLVIYFTIHLTCFGFIPAENNSENNSILVVSEKDNSIKLEKTKVEANVEANTEAKPITTTQLLQKLEVNKSKMSLKERLATKLITHKLKKLERQSKKEVQSSKDTQHTKDKSPLGVLFKILGILLIILGVVGLFTTYPTAGITMIIVGVILFILPYLI